MSKYQKSHEYFEIADRIIPLASQTYSKSYLNFPQGHVPLFLDRGQGSHVWDIDDHEYIDCMSGLLSILVGYNDPLVNEAIITQLQKGISFSLATKLEYEVAEKIVSLLPCAEMVRFGKNGSDATTGAVKLARAYTRRNHIAVCGYHGWHDWYMASTPQKLGIPDATIQMTHAFIYNDIESLEIIFAQHPNEIAAVILEPMNKVFPQDDFLYKVKKITHQHNALLVFDETITGFRFGLGGAQQYFDVVPDLTTVGKGMANGMPLSALVGKREVMELIKDIHYSFTFGGETLSLAAANKVLELVVERHIPNCLVEKGRYLNTAINKLINHYGLSDCVRLLGHYSWQFIEFSPIKSFSKESIMSLWKYEMINNGILISTSFNLMYAHTLDDLDRISNVVEIFLVKLLAIKNGDVGHDQYKRDACLGHSVR